MPVDYWVYHWNADEARTSFAKTPHIISFYSKLFGYDYPWAKYDQICLNDFIWGGMENTSATLLTDENLFTFREVKVGGKIIILSSRF